MRISDWSSDVCSSDLLLDDDVALLRRELGMPLPAPRSLGEGLHLARRDLVGVRMVPAFIVAGLPAMMRHDEHGDPGRSDRGGDRAQIVQQLDLLGDLPDIRPELAPLR